MRALITGANGQVGWELQQTRPAGWQIIALTRPELDICDSAAVDFMVQKHKPDLVINVAAYTAVDKAENEKTEAFAVNREGAGHIARAAEASGARLIHISTDFIFDGSKPQPYLPEDRPNPLSVYGTSKLQGERAALTETGNKALILRTGWVYSAHGRNFVKTMLQLMRQRAEITVVADQVGTPTWARNLAKAIYRMAALPVASGIYHWTDAGVASWYDFAVAIKEEAVGLNILQNTTTIKPIRTEDYPTAARRPPYSVLDKTATWQTLGYTATHWRTSLRQMLADLQVRSQE